MNMIIEELNKKSNLLFEKGASKEMIEKAEAALGLHFADDYKDYLHQFGTVSCGGHEMTGLSEDKALDVVKVTINNLEKNQNVKTPLYVIEETHMDGIVIWQCPSGEVFKTEYKDAPELIYLSLTDYVSTFENSV